MTALNRFLSQVYLKEDSHHSVIENILSKIDKCHHRERVLGEETLTVGHGGSPRRAVKVT